MYFYGFSRHPGVIRGVALRDKDLETMFTPEDQWPTVDQLKKMTLSELLTAMPVMRIGMSDYGAKQMMPHIHCMDGTKLSVQASKNHYCTPRKDNGPYNTVEVGYPETDPGLMWEKYADDPNAPPTETVYGYIPIELVSFYIGAHGGIDYEKTFENFKYGLR